MRKFTQLSCHEREKIYRGRCDGKSNREIAIMIERAPSTISREIHRNSDHIGYLYPGDAHQMAQKRRNINVAKINKNGPLRNYILACLQKRWSPITIAGSWRLRTHEKISPEAIYQWIYSDEGEAFGLKKLLVRAHKKRGTKRTAAYSKIKNRVSVHRRPQSINDRSEFGHYECDLIFNRGSQSQNICTLIDRVTRQAILIRNDNKYTKTVIGGVIDYIRNSGLDVKSITFDNGSEFAEHWRLKDELGIDTYFCDPGAPWQKGGIEHLNGMLRRYLPFEAPAWEITRNQVAKVNAKINNMPRAILSYKTPNEVFNELCWKDRKKRSSVKAAWPAAGTHYFNQKESCVAFHY